MIAIFGFLTCALLAMFIAPQTPFARLCHRELVERPVAAISRFRSHHVLYAIILVPVMLSGGEFIAVLGADFFAAYALELAIYFDALAVSVALSIGARVRGAVHALRAVAGRPLARLHARPGHSRAARRPSTASPRAKAANDDDRHPLLLAA